MNLFNKIVLALLALNLLIAPGFADLLEEVDNLTPGEAVELQNKLQQKSFAALPENLKFSVFTQLVNPSQLNNAFPGVESIRNLYGASVDLRYPLTEQFLLGGSFAGAGNYVFNESSSKIYEDLFLFCGNAQLVAELRLIKTQAFMLSTAAGWGIMAGGFNYSKTDENVQTYYVTNRWGWGFCNSLSLDLSWKIYEEWGLGIGLSSFSGKLGHMRKVLSGEDASAPEIDLGGTCFKIVGSKVF